MSVNDDELRAVVRESSDNAGEILVFVSSCTDSPLLGMTSLMLASAVFAKSMGLPRQSLLDGTAAAFDSLQEATPYATH
jgi:hypothetical protein